MVIGVGVVEGFARLRPHGITITAGQNAALVAPQKYRVPKRDLVASLQVRFQNRTIWIAKGLPHAELLRKEALAFRAKISASGHDTYEAWREQEHDDLVLAAAMGTWFCEEAFRCIEQAARDALVQHELDAQGPYQISPI